MSADLAMPELRRRLGVLSEQMEHRIQTTINMVVLDPFELGGPVESICHEACHVVVVGEGIDAKPLRLARKGYATDRYVPTWPVGAVADAVKRHGHELKQEILTVAAEAHLLRWIGILPRCGVPWSQQAKREFMTMCFRQVYTARVASRHASYASRVSAEPRARVVALQAASMLASLCRRMRERPEDNIGLPFRSPHRRVCLCP